MPVITTPIQAVQADNGGGVRVAFGDKWNNILQITPNAITEVARSSVES